LTREDVLNIIDLEKPDGLSSNSAVRRRSTWPYLEQAGGVTISGTSPDAIDRAEDRKRFQQFLQKLNLRQPENDTAYTLEEALTAAKRIGYPVVVRPSYVSAAGICALSTPIRGIRDFMQAVAGPSREHPGADRQIPAGSIEVDVGCDLRWT